MTKDERERMIEELDDEGRDYLDSVLLCEHNRVRRLSRSRLSLVPSANSATSLPKSMINPFPVGRAG